MAELGRRLRQPRKRQALKSFRFSSTRWPGLGTHAANPGRELTPLAFPMAALLDTLLDASVDDGTTLLTCVCVCCGPPSLLALTRCSTRLRLAVAAPLQQAEQRSAAKVTEHTGATLEQLAAGNIVAWRAGLSHAQCRHLGVWLQPGGPLEGVTTLRLQKDDNKVTTIGLAPIRSGATVVWDLSHDGVDDELMTILARLIEVNGALTVLQ